jgi:hypothetical protein
LNSMLKRNRTSSVHAARRLNAMAGTSAVMQASQRRPRDVWRVPAIILSGVALIAALLALVGYGVSWAVETRFGVPHSAVFASTADLIDLSSMAVVALIELAAEILESFKQALSWNTVWQLRCHLLVAPFMIWLLVAVSVRYGRSLHNAAARLQPGMWLSRRGNLRAAVPTSILWVPVLSIGMFVTAWLGVLLTLVLAMLIALRSLAGHKLGVAYIDKWVVGADACTPLVSANSRLKAGNRSDPEIANPETSARRRVNCVAISKAGQRLIKGRVLVATSAAIVVFEPTSGVVLREQLSGLTVEVVNLADTLDSAQTPAQRNPPPAAPSTL